MARLRLLCVLHAVLCGYALNLVPSTPSDAPGYWCSWQAQGRGWMHGANGLAPTAVDAYWRNRSHESWMEQSNQNMAFSNGTERVGWAWLFPRARADLFLMFDNGWQLGAEPQSDRLAWDPTKWPMFGDNTSALAPLKRFTAYVKAQGWKGTGLWVNGGDGVGVDQMKILAEAGVGVLKADGGDLNCEKTALARQYAPGLVVEHGTCVQGCPLNTGSDNGTRASTSDMHKFASVLNCTDVLRTYDTVRVLSIPTVLDRQAQLLQYARNLPQCTDPQCLAQRLLGGSGEPTVTVALGGVLQPMRSNLRGMELPAAMQTYAGEGGGSRGRQHREDEVERLARWGRLAAPFGVAKHGPEQIELDTAVLRDSWKFKLCDDAAVISHGLENKTVEQAAPARVTRGGLPLPSVRPLSPGGLVPFVVSTKFPSGAVSISTLGRTIVREYSEPLAHVNQTIPTATPTTQGCPSPRIGVFGKFASLTIDFSAVAASSCRVWAQDLASNEATDVTEQLSWDGRMLRVSGTLIDSLGTAAKSRVDDVSPPGLLLALRAA